MKEKLIVAAKAALIAFIGALTGAATAPDLLASLLKALGIH